MKQSMARWAIAAGATAATCFFLVAAGAQEPPKPNGGEDAAEPKTVWPVGLEKLAGKYLFLQVASPGGLWESSFGEGERGMRQVSINEVPAVLRDRLTHAEITISDLTLPTHIEASQRLSPTKRGMLRFYTESGVGRLVMKNLPGIGGNDGDEGAYSGPVVFHLEHQSHSNPSPNGVFKQRSEQEMTWGAATLDYADLMAESIPKEPKPGAPGAAAPAAAAPVQPPAAGEDGEVYITNARVMRSGVEIFAYINWTLKGKKPRLYTGSVRLIRAEMLKNSERPLGPPRPAPIPQRRPDT